MAQIFGTGTVVFRFRKAELAGAFCFAQESGYSIFYGIFLADNDTGEGIFGFGNKEIIVISGGIYIRRIGISIIVIFIYYAIMTLTTGLGKGGVMNPLLACIIPNLICLGAGVFLLQKKNA